MALKYPPPSADAAIPATCSAELGADAACAANCCARLAMDEKKLMVPDSVPAGAGSSDGTVALPDRENIPPHEAKRPGAATAAAGGASCAGVGTTSSDALGSSASAGVASALVGSVGWAEGVSAVLARLLVSVALDTLSVPAGVDVAAEWALPVDVAIPLLIWFVCWS